MRANGPRRGHPARTVAADAPAPGAAKAAWRSWARALRRAWAADPQGRARDENALRAWLEGWDAWRDARCVLAYVAFADELDPIAPAVRAGGRRGPTLATTRTVGPGEPLEIRAWIEPFERHPFGFLQPRSDAPAVDPASIDLVLVPGLAFDVRGARLGYGQGHFDRLLPGLPLRAPRVGVAHDAWVVERLPAEAHDVPMTHLLTPSGLRTLPAFGLSDAARP